MTKFTQKLIFDSVLNAMRKTSSDGYDDNQGADFHLYLTHSQIGELIKKIETLRELGY